MRGEGEGLLDPRDVRPLIELEFRGEKERVDRGETKPVIPIFKT